MSVSSTVASGAKAEVRSTSRRPSRARSFLPRAVLLGLVPVALVALGGLPYYVLDLGERLRSPLHDWLKPSGRIGQSAGFLAFGLFLFLWLYPLRKRLRVLAGTGSLGKWLDAHIAAGILVPLVGAVHAAWRFTGLIGMGYGAMLVVALSGIVGRYLYVHIPRSRDGLELSRAAVADERRALVGRLVESTGIPAERIGELLRPVPLPESGQGTLAILGRMVRDDLQRRRAIRRLLAEWRREARGSGETPDRRSLRETTRLARREMALSQQIRLLEGTSRVFRHWHVAHQPFAITAFVAVVVHVVVVIALGATWIR
jgi:hypothetical protein